MTDPKYHTETINGYTFRLCKLPGGTFEMGSETEDSFWENKPVHTVRLSPFYMAEFLVTQALWKAVMGLNNNPSRFKGDDRPVERVSWIDIVQGNQEKNSQPAFLECLNTLTRDTRPEGYFYRLPTEAEWEYAARANSPYVYSGSDNIKEVAWFNKNSHSETKKVGLKKPNNFDLYDMSGNVEEWCWDWVSDSYYQECFDEGIVNNPTGPATGRHRVVRGGFWLYVPQALPRLVSQFHWLPSSRYRHILVFGWCWPPVPRERRADRPKWSRQMPGRLKGGLACSQRNVGVGVSAGWEIFYLYEIPNMRCKKYWKQHMIIL